MSIPGLEGLNNIKHLPEKNNTFSMISTRHLSSNGKNENKLTCT
jgi:hypothetical protein